MCDIDDILAEYSQKEEPAAEEELPVENDPAAEERLPTEELPVEEAPPAETVPVPAKKSLPKKLMLAVAAVLAVIAAGALWFNGHYVIAGGVHSRDAAVLDLRDRQLSPDTYEKLAGEMPGCDIRWNVPIGGTRYDSHAAELNVSAVKEGEEALFALFPNLKELDVTKAALTADSFRAIQAAAPGCHIRWSIPIGEDRYDSAAREIQVTDFSPAEVECFAFFDDLRQVDGRECVCYDALLALQKTMPGVSVLWNVPLDGNCFDQDTETLTTGANVGELMEYLAYLPKLETVTVDSDLTAGEQAALMDKYPGVIFDWNVTLCGESFRSTATEISFAGRILTETELQEIETNARRFFQLEVIDLTGCGSDSERLMALREAAGVEVGWEFNLLGVTVSSLAEEIDLSGIRMTGTLGLESYLPCFSRLEKVIMCDCGLPDETMDQLNKKYENIRFVWDVYIGSGALRTDAIAFFSSDYGEPDDRELAKLRYCTDLLVMDLGHRGVTDLSFVEGTPHVKYLILTNTPVTDLSPLAQLQELETLEAVSSQITDLTPLLECESLLDLNICAYVPTGSGEAMTEVLVQMTGLERLWFSTFQLDDEQQQRVVEALPNTEIYCSDNKVSCMGGLWRYHERYYSMRDLLGMYYMDEDSNRANIHLEDGRWVADNEWFITYVMGVSFPDGLEEELGLDLTFTGAPVHLKFVNGQWQLAETGYMEGYLNRPGVS